MEKSIIISIYILLAIVNQCSSSTYFFLNQHTASKNEFKDVYDGSCSYWSIKTSNQLTANYPKMCSLETAHIIVPSGIDQTKMISIVFKMTVRTCTKVNQKCREQLYVEFLVRFRDATTFRKRILMPDWTESDSSRFIPNFFKQKTLAVTLPSDQRKIASIRLTINSKDFIGNILQVSVWTTACLQTITNHAVFPYSVLTGFINGTCVENAVSLLPYLKAKCSSTGYQSFQGICLCRIGYTASGDDCVLCAKDSFKLDNGNGQCTQCGENSFRNSNDSSQICRCKEGFIRYANETNDSSKSCHDWNEIECPDDLFKVNNSIKACMECGEHSVRDSRLDTSQVCRCQPRFYRYKNETEDYTKPCHSLKDFGNCGEEKIVTAVDEIYRFKSIGIGETQYFSCIYGQTDKVKKLNKTTMLSRSCVFANESYSAQWQPLDLSTCKRNNKEKALENIDINEINNKTVDEFSKEISNLTSNTSLINNEKTLQNLTKVLGKILEIENTSIEVKRNVLVILDNVMPINESLISDEIKHKFLEFVDRISESIQQPSFNYSGQNLAVSIQTRNSSEATNISTFDVATGINILFSAFSSKDMVQDEPVASIHLPQTTYDGDARNNFQIISTAFKKHTFFSDAVEKNDAKTKSTKEQWEVGSFIMSAAVKGHSVENLSNPITLRFETSESRFDLPKAKCVFWDTAGNFWSSRGCTTVIGSKGVVTCECNHLTNFAILFNVYQVEEDVLKSQEVLNYISLIGCILSTGCLAATLFAFSCARRKHTRRKTAQLIIINFCIALLLLLITFMLTTKISITSGVVCHAFSGVLHYLLLATFSWTATQAAFLYKKTVRATRNFKGEDRKTFYISFCLAWGVPIIIAGVTSKFTRVQFTEPITNSCIIKGNIFIYSIIIPIACIILFNLVIFTMVMHKVHGHFKTRASFQQSDEKQMWKRAKATMACIVLLGLTWLFGFLAVGDLRTPLQWLFCITNTLQGVFVFVFYVLLNDEVRKAWNSNWTESSFTSTLVSRATNIRKLVTENGLTLTAFGTKSPSPKPKRTTAT